MIQINGILDIVILKILQIDKNQEINNKKIQYIKTKD